MGFTEDITKLSEQVKKRSENLAGEQATKQALILPFFSALGYDVWNPAEVLPEYISDAAKKKSGQFEKVDYAISINETIVMLVETKARDQKPEAHDGQLGRYFTWTLPAKVGIVTNGIEYRFFTDLRERNIMDRDPFFSFNVLDYEPKDLDNLKFFHRDNFDATAISRHAEEMVYVKGMTKLVGELLRSPSEEFIRFLVGEVGKVASSCAIEGRITNRVLDKFKPIIKKSIKNSLLELMTSSLNQEMDQPGGAIEEEVEPEVETPEEINDANRKVITTEEELEAFEKIKAITATSTTHRQEIGYKDVAAYFGVHISKPHWWFLRLYLTARKKSFITRLPIHEVQPLAGEFEVQEVTTSLGGDTTRIIFSSVADLDSLAPLVVKCYETEAEKHPVKESELEQPS